MESRIETEEEGPKSLDQLQEKGLIGSADFLFVHQETQEVLPSEYITDQQTG